MDPSSRLPADDDDDGGGWDADDFQIPSLDTAGGKQAEAGTGPGQGAGGCNTGTAVASGASHGAAGSGGQGIYLGPHGGPRKLPEPQPRKQRLKHKLKDADKKGGGGSAVGGRENKVEVLRDLMGTKSGTPALAGPATDWLEPYCQESQFDRSSSASRG